MPDLSAGGKDADEMAGAALRLAMDGDWAAAYMMTQAIYREHGSGGVQVAVLAWCDTLATEIGFQTVNPDGSKAGDLCGAEDVTARIAWAGQLIGARARLDRPMFNALIAALPADRAVTGSHVGAVLEVAAATLQRHRSGEQVTFGG